MKILVRVLIILLILAIPAALLVVMGVFSVEKERDEPQQPVPVVRTEVAQPDAQRVRLALHGRVHPRDAATLTAVVGGRVVYLAEDFRAGRILDSGTVVARVDTATYVQALANADAAIARRQQNLAEIEAQAQQRQADWQDTGRDWSQAPPLARLVPQLEATRAELAAARADRERAAWNLEHTVIRTPYRALVRERAVGLGTQLAPGQALGQVVEAGQVEVRVPATPRDLALLRDASGAIAIESATATLAAGTDRGWSWPMRFQRTGGDVDERSQTMPLIFTVLDPFRETDNPPLLPGTFVGAELSGPLVEGVVLVPRQAMADAQHVWLVRDGRLHKQRVSVHSFHVIDGDEHAAVTAGIERGARLCLTRLGEMLPGMAVRLASETAATDGDTGTAATGEDGEARAP